MALIPSAEPIAVTYTFRDNNGNVATTSAFFSPTLTLAALNGKVVDLGAALKGVTNAQLLGATASFGYTEDAPGIAPPESEVERKLILVGATSNRRQKVRYFVPSPKFTLEVDGSDAVNPANADYTALVAQLIAGGVLPGNGPVNVSGLDVLRIESAFIEHNARSKRR